MTLDNLDTSFYEKLCLHNVDIFKQVFKKDQALSKKYIAEKDDFDILRSMNFCVFNDL